LKSTYEGKGEQVETLGVRAIRRNVRKGTNPHFKEWVRYGFWRSQTAEVPGSNYQLKSNTGLNMVQARLIESGA
jgi:hypothetical protein